LKSITKNLLYTSKIIPLLYICLFLRQIGVGGFAKVFLATEKSTGKPFAIKWLTYNSKKEKEVCLINLEIDVFNSNIREYNKKLEYLKNLEGGHTFSHCMNIIINLLSI
jgi:serine/threonine protein kinase